MMYWILAIYYFKCAIDEMIEHRQKLQQLQELKKEPPVYSCQKNCKKDTDDVNFYGEPKV